MSFYGQNKNKDDLIDNMLIEEGIIMGNYGKNPPLMKARCEMKIEDRRCKIVLEKSNKCRMAKNQS